MLQLIILFVLILCTLLARYLVFGAFEPIMLALSFLLPLTALILFLVSKRLANKEQAYQPANIEDWSFYHIQKILLMPKPLFKGGEKRGFIQQYFLDKRKHAIADLFGYNWYLSLKVKIDGDLYDVRWQRRKRFSYQDYWKIYRNGEAFGEAKTLLTLKNSAKLKEALQFNFSDMELTTSAITVNASISLTQDRVQLGTLKRKNPISGVQVLHAADDRPEYLLALIVHSFYFKGNK